MGSLLPSREVRARLNVHISGISGIENDSEFITEYQWRLDAGMVRPCFNWNTY